MSDIFICYSRSDRSAATQLFNHLESKGWTVFMDVHIDTGQQWARDIERELADARVVVALWSSNSIKSRFVMDEANGGARRHILLPVRIADVDIPYGFRQFQTANLLNWNGEHDHPGLAQLLTSIQTRLNGSSANLPRPVGANADDRRGKFRILSIDSGGTKAAFAASCLASLEEYTGRTAGDHFDLVVGTSSGSFLALGIGLGLPTSEIIESFRTQSLVIFGKRGGLRDFNKSLRQMFQPAYSLDPLREWLVGLFGARKFGDSKCRMVIPTYDATTGRTHLFRTAHHERFRFDIGVFAADIALASAATPMLFPAARLPIHEDTSYLDGGLWASNPVLVGVTEALGVLGVRIEDLDVLSIGCTETPTSFASHVNSGALKWNVGMIELLIEAQKEAAINQAKILLGDRVHRIDAFVREGEYRADEGDPEKIDQLISLGRREALKGVNLEVVQSRFLNGSHAPPFVPKHIVQR